MPPRWYVLLLAAIGAARLWELRVSRDHERITGGTRAAASTYPVMVGAHVALLTLPMLEVRRHPRRAPNPFWLAVLGAAVGLRVWSIRTLGDSWNTRAAVPANLEPVTGGPYRFIRHPNYVAVILEFAALPMIAGAWVSASVLSAVNAAVLYDRIRDEERLLDASPAYRRAFARRYRFLPLVF